MGGTASSDAPSRGSTKLPTCRKGMPVLHTSGYTTRNVAVAAGIASSTSRTRSTRSMAVREAMHGVGG